MSLQVAFLPLDSQLAARHWANRATACISQSEFIHCELIIPKRGAFSIVADGKVFMDPNKTFSRKDWRFLNINITHSQHAELMRWCSEQVGKSFNKLGYYLVPLGGWSGGGKKWFCSELCGAALNAIGLRLSVEPHKLTPGLLMSELMQSPQVVKSAHPTRGAVLELHL